MQFSAFWGINLRTKEHVFYSRKCDFQQSVTQSIPTSNKQLMKTKLCTFARKYNLLNL